MAYESLKGTGLSFNSSLSSSEAKSSTSKGTVHFTTDGEIVLNGEKYSGVTKVEESTSNGKVKVDGTDVAVHGLGSAAYTASTAYATSAQGGKADSAVQTIKIGSTTQTKSNGTVTLPAYPTTLPASDVSAWAKASTKPTYTKSEVGLGNVTNDAQVKRTEMGAANGVATLDANGQVPSSQLPSYVDDVLEGYLYNGKFYKESAHTTEITAAAGKIYVNLTDNKTYRWSGSQYTVISETVTIGTVEGTAFDGLAGYNHIRDTSNPHGVTKAQVGLSSVTNNKQVKGLASGTTADHVVTWGADGYTVKDSGFTIGKSVPSTAVFTDANCTETGHYTPSTEDTNAKLTASGATGSTSGTVQVVTAIKRDSKNHVVGITSGAITIPTTLPASDVKSWAKAASKPTYNAGEVKLSSSYAKASTGSTSFTAGTTTVDGAIGSLAAQVDAAVGMINNHTGQISNIGQAVNAVSNILIWE